MLCATVDLVAACTHQRTLQSSCAIIRIFKITQSVIWWNERNYSITSITSQHNRPLDVHWISLRYHTFKRWPIDVYRISSASWVCDDLHNFTCSSRVELNHWAVDWNKEIWRKRKFSSNFLQRTAESEKRVNSSGWQVCSSSQMKTKVVTGGERTRRIKRSRVPVGGP